MQGSWSSGLHMATVVHNLHPLNLSWLLLGLISELPSGHLQGQNIRGGESGAPWSAPWYEGGMVKGLPKQLRGGLQGRGRWRHSKSISPSFFCGLESFYCHQHLPPLSSIFARRPLFPRAQPSPAAAPTKANLIAGAFAMCFSLVSEFYVAFGNKRE